MWTGRPSEQEMSWFCYCCCHLRVRKLRQLSSWTHKLYIILGMPGLGNAREEAADSVSMLVNSNTGSELDFSRQEAVRWQVLFSGPGAGAAPCRLLFHPSPADGHPQALAAARCAPAPTAVGRLCLSHSGDQRSGLPLSTTFEGWAERG